MARNEEKSQSMLNRFLQMKEEEKKPMKETKPHPNDCHNLVEAEKWRTVVLRGIGKLVSEIQNEGLGEHKIRDLNDEINKMIREKIHWERRIIDLGGQNYLAHAPKIQGTDPGQAPEGSSYKYFGAAKKLPGVKDLFFQPKVTVAKRTRGEMYRGIDSHYYGWDDDDDGLLLKLEAAQTIKLMKQAEEEFRDRKKQKIEAMAEHKLMVYDATPPVSDNESNEEEEDQEQEEAEVEEAEPEPEPDEPEPEPGREETSSTTTNTTTTTTTVSGGKEEIGYRVRRRNKSRNKLPDLLPPKLPSSQDLEKALLVKKKEELLKRYVSPDLQADLSLQEPQVKVVLGKRV